MARTPDGLEQISDEQRALDLYLLAEKRYYELPEGSPDDAALLQTMATALLARAQARTWATITGYTTCPTCGHAWNAHSAWIGKQRMECEERESEASNG